MREYTTRTHHLGGVRSYPAGTSCLCARLPSDVAVLTFEDESIVLGRHWYLDGYESPSRALDYSCFNMSRSIYVQEDARVMEYLDETIRVLQAEKIQQDGCSTP